MITPSVSNKPQGTLPDSSARKGQDFNAYILPLSDTLAEDGVIPVMYFPAYPQQLDINRRSEFTFPMNPATPDSTGVFYKGTEPLRIPFSFTVHHTDREVCTRGPMTIIKMASFLHAILLPSTRDITGDPYLSAMRSIQNNGVMTRSYRAYFSEGQMGFDPPAPIRLCIFKSGSSDSSPGIYCQGLIESVDVSLKGPWLKAEGVTGKLPSIGEFKFSFVHAPSYASAFSSPLGSAYSLDVYKSFYNTQPISNRVADFVANNPEFLASSIDGSAFTTPTDDKDPANSATPATSPSTPSEKTPPVPFNATQGAVLTPTRVGPGFSFALSPEPNLNVEETSPSFVAPGGSGQVAGFEFTNPN